MSTSIRSTSLQCEVLLDSAVYGDTGQPITRRDFIRHTVEVVTDAGVAVVLEVSTGGENWYPIGTTMTGASFQIIDAFFPYLRARRTDTDPEDSTPAPQVKVIIESGYWLPR